MFRSLPVFFSLLLLSSPAAAAPSNAFLTAVDRGPVYAAFAALLGGLLVSLTPCVYPMIAITVSIFGAKKSEGRLHAIGLSLAFVAGIIAMFVPLGVTAGLTGSLFGAALQSPWVLVGVAGLFLVMAASMFGAFEVALPSALTNRLARVGGLGAKGAFGLGLVCGLIAAPCTGPVLTGILTWIAQSQSPWAGAAAMFAFSLGLGFPFFLVGAFAVELPKSGRWMIHVKSVLAIILAVVALYYLDVAFPMLGAWVTPGPLLYGICALVIPLGVLLGAIHRDFASPLLEDKVQKSIGASSVTIALFAIVIGLSTPSSALEWKPLSLTAARLRAQREHRPLIVDFTAAWCGACKEFDKITFAHPDVNREAGRFLAVKVDATDDEDPKVAAAMQAANVRGLPTVVVFNSRGGEETRFTDFVGPGEFLAALRTVN